MAQTIAAPHLSEPLFSTNVHTSTTSHSNISDSKRSVQVREIEIEDKEKYLTVSPYKEVPHLLDLSTLDTSNQLLAKALVGLRCLADDYATRAYIEAFNWPEVVQDVKRLSVAANHKWEKTSFYIVVFRSRIPPTTRYEDLGVLDKAAHAEATKSGGFLKYWFGSPDSEGRNLATCVWRNLEDARIGSVGEAHRRAAGATRLLYTEWKIERLRLTIQDDAASWSITEWDS